MTGSRTPTRSGRDWVVDLAAFLLSVGVGCFIVVHWGEGVTPKWLIYADHAAGVLACAAIWLHRRWPFQLAVVLTLITAFSGSAVGAASVARFNVAVRQPLPQVLVVGLLAVATRPVYAVVRSVPISALPVELGYAIARTVAVLGWGLFVRHRRELLASLRDRAAHAESDARLRAEQAQAQTREQIAREMHDVLGHRLSLLAVHAGALEYRRNASPTEVASAASVIRSSAHQALQDLRAVIGVLRAPVGGELPLPTLADVDDLVAECRRAGMRVTLHRELPDPVEVPELPGRTAYRIIQEGLTNARKHAPGAEATVRLRGNPENGLNIELQNSTRPSPAESRAGTGLIGLAERAALTSGYLAYQHDHTGWRLWAWLPWSA
ncbi:MAG TPA: histidine kinase [Pseudonocardia sp.]|uniref:sensor histidine kinase n=1 Tax=Pseudonocardia sp. TaxID=60912 RepID=UPI002F41DF41